MYGRQGMQIQEKRSGKEDMTNSLWSFFYIVIAKKAKQLYCRKRACMKAKDHCAGCHACKRTAERYG